MKKAAEIVKKLTLAEKLRMLTSNFAGAERLGLKPFNAGTEVARGYVSHGEGGKTVDISTVLPQPVGLASTFDRDLMYKLGKIVAEELRYYWKAEKQSKLMLFGPTVDLLRDPRWGRNEEAYGEDPFLSGSQALAYCTGLTEPDRDAGYMKTAPGLKHFCANNHEESRIRDNANVTMKLLHEYYYAPFRRIISAGKAAGVMASYNELGGVPAVMNPDLKKYVKGKWGADYVTSDGADFSQSYLFHKQFVSHAEAFAITVKNGTDCMIDDADMVETAAREALRIGLITEEDIDTAVLNTLTVREKLGEFDPDCEYNKKEFSVDTEEFKALNKQAAYEQVCLLKNDGILPLSRDKKVALIGPIANENYNDWYTGTASYYVSVKGGFERVFENVTFDNGYDHVEISGIEGTYEHHDWGENSTGSIVTFRELSSRLWLSEDEQGNYNPTAEKVYDWFTKQLIQPAYDKATDTYTFKSVFDAPLKIKDGKIAVSSHARGDRIKINVVSKGTERAEELAKNADTAVVVVGNQPLLVARECFDRKTLKLPPQQAELIRATAAANPNTVLVIVSSYPYILEDIEKLVKAVVYTTHAGAELGNAISDVVAGLYNPAARTPQTWYKYDSDLPSIKDYRIDRTRTTYQYFNRDALFPFGHGLSYAKFSYANFTAKLADGYIDTSFNITNTSEIDGDEVWQIYITRQNREKLKSLCGYGRANIKAGETETVSMRIPLSDIAEYNTETGEMEPLIYKPTEVLNLCLGSSSTDIKATQILSVSEADGFTLLTRDLFKRTLAKSYDLEMNTTLGFDYKKNDWYVKTKAGGRFTFVNTNLMRATGIEIAAAAPNIEAKLAIDVNGNILGETIIKPSISHTDYKYYTIPLPPTMGNTLTVLIEGQANIWSIQLK